MRSRVKSFVLFSAMLLAGLGPACSAPPITAGLVLHLDACAITGLGDSDKVAQWNDLSGNDNHVLQSDPALMPAYVAAGWNDTNPCVRSSRARVDRLTNGDMQTGIDRTTGAMIFMVINIPNSQQGGIYELSDSLNDVNRGISLIPWDSTMYSRGPRGTGSDITYPYTFNMPLMLTQRFAPDTGENAELINRHKFWENGILKGTQNPVWDNRIYNKLVLIALTDDGRYGRDADIAEMLIYNRALPDAEREAVEQYLGHKWMGWPAPPRSGAFITELF